MGFESLVDDVADGGRNLVFVSYSHEDAQWMQRFTVLLKPLVRSKRLQLWTDTDIRFGNPWHPDILGAIERSSVALLLVSADFLNSDFIMEQELPALIEHHVQLAAVLVGDCLWDHVPELKRVQWLHGPGRDDALNLLADQPGQRDQRLREICERLIERAPEGPGDLVAAPPPVVDTPPVAAMHAGPERGELSGVPALPPGYLVREELAAVIEAVVAVDGGAVGLVPAVGLHDQGGIGKSVLAAAVARDEGIGRRFPDGVYWVTVGVDADVLGVQLELLARIGARDRVPRTRAEALGYLREALAERRVLLVIDDVWSNTAAQEFRATGPHGRVLYTSRNPQVLVAAGARLQPVDVLSPPAARALAAAILDVAPSALPTAADRAFADVGHVALAVALLAAAVRGYRSWDEIACTLRRDTGIFGNHPYANAFKAMQIAVAALPSELVDALFSLAVFPPDSKIPVAAITRYWAHTYSQTAEQTLCCLDSLAAANVLSLDENIVGFHDLQHDYLLLHASTLALLHTGLLDAYRDLLPADGRDQWWRLPLGEPYVWDHLVQHLRGAGEHQVLATTVTDPAYLVQQIAAGGPHAAEADLSWAAAALPTDKRITWWRGWIARHAHLLTPCESITSNEHAAAVSPTMLAWLTADGSLPKGVDPDRLIPLLPDPHLRARWGLTSPNPALLRVLTGHTTGVNAMAWSPDSSRLASADDDGQVWLWDPVTGHHLSTLSHRTSGNPVTGHHLFTLRHRTSGVRAVAWSPDGTRLTSVDDDGQVWRWNPATERQLSEWRDKLWDYRSEHEKIKVVFTPDGTRIASVGWRVRLRDLVTGRDLPALIRYARRHPGDERVVAWSPDGSRLASVSRYGQVRLWDPATGHHLSTVTRRIDWLGVFYNWVGAVAWSPDGRYLATAGPAGKVRLWDLSTGRQLSTLSTRTDLAHTGWRGVQAVAWSPDSTRVATASTDGEIRLWEPTTGLPLSTFTGHAGRVEAVAWSPDGTRLASADDDGQVRLWDSTTSHQLSILGYNTRGVRAVTWSPDGTRLAAAGTDGKVQLWELASGRQLSTGHTSRLRALAGRISLATHREIVRAVAWSPDGTRLATVNFSGRVRLWDPADGRQLSVLGGSRGRGWVGAVAWSPDGTCLAAIGFNEKKIRLWDLVSGRQLSPLIGHTGALRALAWSPDSTRLATAGGRELRFWDLTTGRRHWWRRSSSCHIATLTGHADWMAVAWSPDGTRLAAASDNGVRVWDPASGQQLATLTGHPGRMLAVAWAPDGTRLATASGEGTVSIFDLDCPDQTSYLRVESLTCLQWAKTGIAVGGPHGVAVLDLVCT